MASLVADYSSDEESSEKSDVDTGQNIVSVTDRIPFICHSFTMSQICIKFQYRHQRPQINIHFYRTGLKFRCNQLPKSLGWPNTISVGDMLEWPSVDA